AAWPGPDEGYAACMEAARSAGSVPEGRVGAGSGATVGKLLGAEHSCPGGVGSAAVRIPCGAVVGALAGVHALGAVYGHEGRLLAGARAPDGTFAGAVRVLLEEGTPDRPAPPPLAGANTTLAVVATNATLDRAQCRKLAELAQDGLALAIRPAHTMFDGDAVF